MKYVTAEDIKRYQRQHQRLGEPLDLVAMVNFFSEGVATSLSNFLYEQIAEEGRELRHGKPKRCRCSGCREWQLVDEGGVIVVAADSLADWARPPGLALRNEGHSPGISGALDVEESIAEQVEALRASPFHEEAVEDVLNYVRTQSEEQARATVRAYYAYKLRFEALKCRAERAQRNDQEHQGAQA